MPSNHLILCHPLLLPSIFPSIGVFSNESALRIRWPKDWTFSFNISPSNEHPRLISFRMDSLDLLFGVFINDTTIYPVAQTANLQVVLETFYPHHLHLITQPCAYHLQNVISNLSTFLPFPNTTLTLTSNILTDESLPNDLPELIL